MNLYEQFEQAVANSKLLSQKPDNQTLLQLYSLYKQANEGDNNEAPPVNAFDIVAKAKYQAWLGQKGKDKEAAMQEYINLVNKLRS